MLNSGDLLLVEIFFLLLPGIIILVAFLLISYFYARRFSRVMRRYKIQKLEEVENERKRIANDLHDFVAGKLIKIKSELHESLNAASEPLVYKNISQGISDLNKFHDDLRHLVEYIYPKELISGNIKQGFIRLAAEMSNADTEIIMDIEFEHQLPRDKMHQLYRLIQEKIANILVYEKPPKIFIGLFENSEDNEVLLNISYPGTSRQKAKSTTSKRTLNGRGKFIINERLKVLKARVERKYQEEFYEESIIFSIK